MPSAVEVIRRRWDAGEPIHFPDMTIPAHQIVEFRRTSRPYGQPLLDAAAQAFNEEMTNPDGSIVFRWVKKNVTSREYNKSYRGLPAYRRLGEENGMVVVAWRLPVHEIDVRSMSYCDENEINVLQGP